MLLWSRLHRRNEPFDCLSILVYSALRSLFLSVVGLPECRISGSCPPARLMAHTSQLDCCDLQLLLVESCPAPLPSELKKEVHRHFICFFFRSPVSPTPDTDMLSVDEERFPESLGKPPPSPCRGLSQQVCVCLCFCTVLCTLIKQLFDLAGLKWLVIILWALLDTSFLKTT